MLLISFSFDLQQLMTAIFSVDLSLHFNGHFPGEPGLASFYLSKDDGSDGDNWSYKSCKAPVKS